ncbi:MULTISPECIES: hypothetical protein [unclassified Bradyrhizobium]|jgi:hypothetical protein
MITTTASRIAAAPALSPGFPGFLNRYLVVLHSPWDYLVGEPAVPGMPSQPGAFRTGGH